MIEIKKLRKLLSNKGKFFVQPKLSRTERLLVKYILKKDRLFYLQYKHLKSGDIDFQFKHIDV